MGDQAAAYRNMGSVVGSEGDAEQIEGSLLEGGRRGEHVEGGSLFVFGLDASFYDGGQIAEQRLKAVYPETVVGRFGGSLA